MTRRPHRRPERLVAHDHDPARSADVLAHLTLEQRRSEPILDLATATSSIDVPSGIGTRVCELTLDTAIAHPSSGDLDITLTSPAGTVVTLTTDNGGANANVFNGTRWDDRADPGGQVPYATNDGLVTDQVYVNGVPSRRRWSPRRRSRAFLGESPAGVWTLAIGDDAAGGTGTLNGWALHLTTCSCAESFAAVAAPRRRARRAALPLQPQRRSRGRRVGSGRDRPGRTPGTTPFTLVTYASNFGGPARARLQLRGRRRGLRHGRPVLDQQLLRRDRELLPGQDHRIAAGGALGRLISTRSPPPSRSRRPSPTTAPGPSMSEGASRTCRPSTRSTGSSRRSSTTASPEAAPAAASAPRIRRCASRWRSSC